MTDRLIFILYGTLMLKDLSNSNQVLEWILLLCVQQLKNWPTSIILVGDISFCKQDFLIVDLKVDRNLWTPVYICPGLKAQAAKNV